MSKDTTNEITEAKLSIIHRSSLQYLSMALIAILLGAGGAYLAIYNAQNGERQSDQKAVVLAEDKQASNICQTTPDKPNCQLAKDIIASQPTNIVGDRGPKGDEGDLGPVGPQGIPGLLGLKGDKGDKGDGGREGLSITGRDGFVGTDGVDGKPGPMGPQGLQGEPGEPGKPGSDATVKISNMTCENDLLTITLSNGSHDSIPVKCATPSPLTPRIP